MTLMDWNKLYMLFEIRDHEKRWDIREISSGYIRTQYKRHECPVCNGSGMSLEPEDAHRSMGYVPCYHNGSIQVSKPRYRIRSRPLD